MKTIAIILPNLRGGGAERLAIYLAHDWLKRGYKVDIVLLKKEGELLPLLSPEINVVNLGASRIRNAIFPFRDYLKKNSPAVTWVGMWPLTCVAVISWLLARRKSKIYLIDHNQLSISCLQEMNVPALMLKSTIRLTYPFATGVMAVSHGVKDDLCRLSGFPNKKVKVIYNPAATGVSAHREPTEIREQLWGKGFDKHILNVGTLKVQKNQELLLRAFAKLPVSLKAKLTILGEGPLRPELEALIADLHLQGRVSLPGFARDPYPWFRSADLFVLSSGWEGLPTVLIEALECGIPIVSTNCPSGPAEILENGRHGRLVPVGDVDALAAAMEASLREPHDRQALINRGKDFSVESISKQYLDYFGLPQHV